MVIDQEILKSFSGKNVLVTGGTGLLGRQIMYILHDAGAIVRSVSLDQVRVHPAVNHVFGDLTDFAFCKQVTQDMDYVFHVAGIKGSIEVTTTKPASFFVPLLMMNTNVLEACRINKIQKVVYTSSIGAYSDAEIFKESDNSYNKPPMDMYPGWAKRMAEFQIQAYKIQYGLDNFAMVRLCNVYGPGDNFDPNNAMVIPSLMCRIFHKENPVIIWGDGSAIRDFAYSEDVAEGVILALYYGTGSRFVNLASGRAYSVRELVETLHSFIPFNYRFDSTKPSGFPKRVMDITLAREMLGYKPPTSLLDGLQKTWQWYIKNQNEHLNKMNYFRNYW